jgi:hypothetical protein
MVALRAAVVALLACLGAGCCCGPYCGPCYGPPTCGYQPYLTCYGCGMPYTVGCPTCGPQFGWQQGYAQPLGQAGCSQCMTQASEIPAAPAVGDRGTETQQQSSHLASYRTLQADTPGQTLTPDAQLQQLRQQIAELKRDKASQGDVDYLRCQLFQLMCRRGLVVP